MLQGTLPHAVFAKPATVAGNIKPEVVRLTHCARGRQGCTSGEIEDELGASMTTSSATAALVTAYSDARACIAGSVPRKARWAFLDKRPGCFTVVVGGHAERFD